MRILALDTSTPWGGVALVERDRREVRVVAERGVSSNGSHADRLMRWIEQALADCGWSRNAPDLYVATCGPGSFTGVRIGLGAIRGLALAADRPCRGVPTLAALAAAYGPTDRVRIPLIDAGRGELFGARYDGVSMPPVERQPPWRVPVAELALRLPVAGCVLLPAPGTRVVAPVPGCTIALAPRGIAAAAAVMASSTDAGTDVQAGPVPLYLRRPDAVLQKPRTA